MRKCKKCGEEKEDHWFRNTGNGEYRRWICIDCFSEQHRKRNYDLQHEYGINEAQYELMLKSQNGVCAICNQPETMKKYSRIQALSVDHDHKTFKIRGLLCNKCNRKLGVLEDEEFMKKAAKYLEQHNEEYAKDSKTD